LAKMKIAKTTMGMVMRIAESCQVRSGARLLTSFSFVSANWIDRQNTAKPG